MLKYLLQHTFFLGIAAFNVNRIAGRLNISDNPPLIPLLGESATYWQHRRSLPIYAHRKEILNQLEHQQVVVIAGDVGCGKTTQVPQYILENAHENKTPCRIISVQPRRISVHAAVDRVTAERGKLYFTKNLHSYLVWTIFYSKQV